MCTFDEPVKVKIDGTLDLHTFQPREIKTLIPAYLQECRNAGIKEIRIIHGKGKGILRKSVHSILAQCEIVDYYRIAGPDSGHWGATLVRLK